MKIFTLMVFILAGFSFSGCSTKGMDKKDGDYYDRANSNSKESLKGLERDTK